MKLSMALTLDGLVRALRATAHGLAEEIEGGYRRAPAPRTGGRVPPSSDAAMRRDERDDVAGR
jgi:hypothetical protein